MSKQWYVVHAYSGFENKVKQALEDRVTREGMDEQFGEILVPTEEVVEMRDGKERRSERKFFPGYVLVRMDMNEETWHLVKSVPRVMGFIGATKSMRKGAEEKFSPPPPITQREVDKILDRVREGVDKPRPKVVFEVGEMVRVNDGPFTDFSAAVEEVNYDKNRLRVAVLILGRSTPVELRFDQVEKA